MAHVIRRRAPRGPPRPPTPAPPCAHGAPAGPPPAAAAAAAYTTLRTNFGRAEALADLARPAGRGRWLARGRLAATGSRPRRWRPAAPGERRRRRPAAGLAAGHWWSRVRRGRPGRLALRVAAAAAVSAGVALVAGPRPATPALITGAVTW